MLLLGAAAPWAADPRTGAVAWGSYVDTQDAASNFGQLHISTGGYPDADQMWAAGFLEVSDSVLALTLLAPVGMHGCLPSACQQRSPPGGTWAHRPMGWARGPMGAWFAAAGAS